MDTLRNENSIGRNVIEFRRRKNWTREQLAAKMQLLGCFMTCDSIANIETDRCLATQKEIMYLAEVFGVRVGEFFNSGNDTSLK
jgi:transcriptional regulator with XRE-family HTH domain